MTEDGAGVPLQRRRMMMGRKVNQNELKKLRRRVLDVVSCFLGRVVVDLDEAEAELDRARGRRERLAAGSAMEGKSGREGAPQPRSSVPVSGFVRK